jgi:hypothetical protein
MDQTRRNQHSAQDFYYLMFNECRSSLTVRIIFTMPQGLLGRLAGALGVHRRAQREAEEVLANVKSRRESGAQA